MGCTRESAAGSVWGPRGTGFYLSGEAEAEAGSVRLKWRAAAVSRSRAFLV